MASWRKTRTPGVYGSHAKRCPAFDDARARCRCSPSWRGRGAPPLTGKPEWQRPVVKNRAEVLAWLGAAKTGREHLAEVAARGPTFEELGDHWIEGVEEGPHRPAAWPQQGVLGHDDRGHAPLLDLPRPSGV